MTDFFPQRRKWPGEAGSRLATELQAVETLIQQQLQTADPFLEPAARHVSQSTGKRLRPAAFLLMVRLVDERPSVPHFVTAAVLELCHTASLLHDDVLDNATVRRGRPTLHTVRGNRETVLFGDYILAGAFRLLAELARPELVAIMAELVSRVCAGEIRQWSHRSFSITEEEYFYVVQAKTASFFRCAGTLTGRLACLGKEPTERLENWGTAFGIAYQIVDDLYDILSPPQADKSTGLDARVGLLTLPWIKLRDRCGMEALTKRYFKYRSGGSGNWSHDELLHEALSQSAAEVQRLLEDAAGALEPFPASVAKETLLLMGEELSRKTGRFLKHA